MHFHPFQQAVAEHKPLIADQNEWERFVFFQNGQAVAGQIQSADEFADRENRRILICDIAVHVDTYLSGSEVSLEIGSRTCLASSSRNAMLS